MNEQKIRKWFENELKKYEDPIWCQHSDLRILFNNILEKVKCGTHTEK